MASAISIVQKFFPEVTDVEDAGKSTTLEVTKRDDASAKRMSHKTCAMAVACKRKFEADGVIISLRTAYIVKGTNAKRYALDESVTREIISFDRGGGFAPGEYRLNKQPESRRLGHQPKGRAPGSKGGKHHEPHHHTEGIRTVLGSKEATE